MSEYFDQSIDKKFDHVNKKIDILDKTISKLNLDRVGEITDLECKIIKLEAELKVKTETIVKLVKEVDAINNLITQIVLKMK